MPAATTLRTLIFFLAFILTTLLTLGGPRGGVLTNGLGQAFLKGGKKS